MTEWRKAEKTRVCIKEEIMMDVMEKIKGGLIVSCQALKTEPLYSSFIMARMAYAAEEGGAVGIRANTPEDILAIKKEVDLPVIGLYKVDYDNSEIYITPTMKEIDALMKVEPDIIAMDATNRIRPDGSTIEDVFPESAGKISRHAFYGRLFFL